MDVHTRSRRTNVTSEGLFIDNTGHLKRLLCVTKCSVPIPLSVLKLCSPKHRGIFVVMNRILNRELSPFLFSPRIYVTQMRRPPRTLEKCEGLLTFFFLLEKNCPGIKLKHTFNVKHIVETLIFLVKQPNMFFVFYEKENCVR